MHTDIADMLLPASTVRGLSSTGARSDVVSEIEGNARRGVYGGSSTHTSKQQALLRVMAQKRVHIDTHAS